MEYTPLGRTAIQVSTISYGTWQFSGEWGHVDQELWDAGKGTVRKAPELGINLFDTAQAYGFGLAERLLGDGAPGRVPVGGHIASHEPGALHS